MGAMKDWGIRGCLAAVMFGFAYAAGPATAQTQWDMYFAWPPGNLHTEGGERFAKRVKEATGGEVEIVVHPGSSLGLKGPEVMAAVRDGIVPIADMAVQQQSGEVPFLSFAAMPGLASGFDETRILMDVARPYAEKIFKQYNQKLLYTAVWPGQGIYAKRPIKSVADLKGLKIRTSDKSSTDYFALLGASPILLPWAEVVPALASGVIEGVTTSSQSGVDGKFPEFMDYFTPVNWANPINMVTVNLDTWNELKPEHQAAIEKIAKEMEAELWRVSRELDDANLKTLTDGGMEVVDPSPEFLRDLAASAAPLWDAYVKQAGPNAAAMIKEFREKAGK